MSEMEERLGSILGNPQLMQQIMTMAQSLGPPQSEAPPPPEPQPSPGVLDPQMLSTLSALASQSQADPQQQKLLQALSPYLSPQRGQKLEKAMRAARLARAASAFLSGGGLSILAGR